MSANAKAARALIRAQPRRSQPVRLPSTAGYSGALVEDATTEQLQACLRKDRLWLYGGNTVDEEGGHYETTGFLGDVSQNPDKWETATEFLANTPEDSANHGAVARVHTRITVIEAELAERAQAAYEEASERRTAARERLEKWHATVPATVTAFQSGAKRAQANWQLVAPLVEALEQLQAAFPNPHGALGEAYERLRVRATEVAEVLGRPAHEFEPLPDGVPTFEQVQHAVRALRTLWPEGGVPKTGLEHISLERTLREARGGDEF